MMKGSQTDPVDFKAPWIIPFENRLAALTARHAHRRVAYYYDIPDSSSFRYRVFNMVEALQADPHSDIAASWFCLSDMDRMERFVDRADVLVVSRARYTPASARMVNRAKARGLPVVFDCDDLVFDTRCVHVVADTLDLNMESDQVLENWFALLARHEASMRMCDRSITTNSFLARHAENLHGPGTARVVQNFLNREQQRLSSEIYRAKKAAGFCTDGEIIIGYFSGSPTHNKDFAIAAPALARLLDDHPGMRLRVVGFLEMKGELNRHADRVEYFPLQDYMNLQRLIAEVEINIAPLQYNMFTNCKSELKYFEAAIGGTITLASPTYTFQNSIVDGENSLLVRSFEWEEKLREACDIVCNSERYAEMAGRGFDHVQGRYGWDRQAEAIGKAIFGD